MLTGLDFPNLNTKGINPSSTLNASLISLYVLCGVIIGKLFIKIEIDGEYVTYAKDAGKRKE